MKSCGTCKAELEETLFHKNRRTNDGLSSRCKQCAIAISKQWRDQNPEKVKMIARQTYLKNPDKYKAAARAWALANPEARKEILQKSERKHAAKYYHHKKIAIKNNPHRLNKQREKSRYHVSLRRTRENENGARLPREWWDALLELFETNACLYCGDTASKLAIDHFIPVARGGKTEMGNLLPCCKSCNSKKGARDPEVWVRDKCGETGISEIKWFLGITREAFLESEVMK